MKIFLGTNIKVDYLACRKDFLEDTALIIEMIRQNFIQASISSLTVINCAYVMRKYYDKKKVLDDISKLLEYIDVTSIDEATINKALKQDPTDFEDAVQYFSSLESNPDLIITRDKKGFNGSSIPFMDAKKFLQSCGYSSDSPQG